MDGLLELSVFENAQFGVVRVKLINGEPWFVAADVCGALEIGNPSQALKRLDEDEKGIISNDTPGGNQDMLSVNEPGLYTLVLGSRKPEARAFKRWITHEVIPAIRKTGSYSLSLSPAEQLVQQAQLLLEQERRLMAVEDGQEGIRNEQRGIRNELRELEAKVSTHPENCYSISGYASIRGIKVDVNKANMLGRKASSLSREYDYGVTKIPDPRFGKVNVYHEDILKEVFEEYLKGN